MDIGRISSLFIKVEFRNVEELLGNDTPLGLRTVEGETTQDFLELGFHFSVLQMCPSNISGLTPSSLWLYMSPAPCHPGPGRWLTCPIGSCCVTSNRILTSAETQLPLPTIQGFNMLRALEGLSKMMYKKVLESCTNILFLIAIDNHSFSNQCGAGNGTVSASRTPMRGGCFFLPPPSHPL